MKFFILFKKQDYDNNCIDEDFLNDIKAPSLISNGCIKKELGNVLSYIYTYKMPYDETEKFSYDFCDDEINFVNGLFYIEGSDLDNSLDSLNFALKNNELILGNYQSFYYNKNGVGYLKSSLSTLHPLFYYEDKNCTILANELKLIVDSVNELKKKRFIDLYDIDYIYEIRRFGNWYTEEDKTTYRNTVFKDIKRITPFDEVTIENDSLNIKFNDKIEIPKWLEDFYLNDRQKFYDWYCETLLNYSDNYLKIISKNTKEITLGITGGYDSRLSLMVLSKLAPKNNIGLKTQTNGLSEHPDVIVGGKVAKTLGVPWNYEKGNEDKLRYYPSSFAQYLTTFYISQGDFDSHDTVENYSRKYETSDSFYQHGFDFYKRGDFYSIMSSNRWFSRRKLFENEFIFPVFATNLEIWISFLCKKYCEYEFEEFIYEVIKRLNPELLDIPFANKKLPQCDIEEFVADGYTDSRHKEQPFLWDYDYVYDMLNPLFKQYYEKTENEKRNLLSQSNINSLDYIILKERIDKILLRNEDDKSLKKRLKRLKRNAFYPVSRQLIDLKEYDNVGRYYRLLFLMDCAVASQFSSFENLEKSCSFNMENRLIETIDNTYEKISRLKDKLNESEKHDKELKDQLKSIKKENNELKAQLNENKNFNDKIMSSKSWKITSIFRK